MKSQTVHPKQATVMALLVVIPILLYMGIVGLINDKKAAEALAAIPAEVMAEVLAVEPPISHCGSGAEILVAPVTDMMNGAENYVEEMLYSYKGERHIVKLPKYLSDKQAELLLYAYTVAQNDGHREPAILQGLIWQESQAGGFPGHEVAGDEYGLRVGKRYYGVGQIKVAAAQDVFKRFPDEFPDFYQPKVRAKQANGKMKTIVAAKYLKTEEEIIAHLILDDEFNIRVASKYLWLMGHNETKDPVFKRPTNYAITAYNRGLGNTYGTDYDNWHYTVGVHKHIERFIADFNVANKVQ